MPTTIMPRTKVIELIWKRTRERGDFPALQRALRSIVDTLQDDMASNTELAATVLSDFTLTQKVLRLANSAVYAPYAKDVTTVSRALLILGTATVSYTAMSIQLIDTFEGLAGSRQDAIDELAQAGFAGKLARIIATSSGSRGYGEEAAVATLMFQLARLLVVFYLPEEWAAIRECLDLGMTEAEAFVQVLGITPEELSEAAMQEWSLPHQVIATAETQPQTDTPVATHQEWLACLVGLSTTLAHRFTKEGHNAAIRDLVDTYAPALDRDPDELERLIRELFDSEQLADAASADELPHTGGVGKPVNAEMRLNRSLTEVTAAATEADVATLTSMVLESMTQGLGLESCVAFFLIAAKNMYEARLGFGSKVKAILNNLSFDAAFVPDVFHVALSQGRAVFLSDIQDEKIAPRIPAWHKSIFPEVRSAVLLPIRVNERSIGMLYGNWGPVVCADGVSSMEIDHLNSMRNLVASAFEEAIKAPLGAFTLIDADPTPPTKKTSRSKPKSS